MATTINPINEPVEEKVCADCGEKVDDDLEENEYDGEYYCEECLESVEKKVCADCGEKVDDDLEENEYDGEYYCEECLGEFYCCEECDNPVPDGIDMFGDDLLYCPNCEDCLEEDEEDEEDEEEDEVEQPQQ